MKVEKMYKQLLKDYEKLQLKNSELKSELKKYKKLVKAMEADNEQSPDWKEYLSSIDEIESRRQKEHELALNELRAKKMECDQLLRDIRTVNNYLKENENTT